MRRSVSSSRADAVADGRHDARRCRTAGLEWPEPHLSHTQPLFLAALVRTADGLEGVPVTWRRTRLGEYVYDQSTIDVPTMGVGRRCIGLIL